MISEVFASEETVALAKEKACKMLGVTEDKVDIQVLQHPSKKVLGMFGGKMAQVKAVLKKSSAEKAIDFLKEVLFYMGLSSLETKVIKEDPESAEIQITGDDIGYVLGKHGETLDSLEYITGLVINSNSDSFYRIRLEAGDYREKRKQTLETLGKRIAEKVLKTGKKFSLEPMRAYERKIIHTAIQDVDGVKSWSEGTGEGRHIVVALDRNKEN